ncbi:hypothetical protein Tco_0675056 [Tanacetum coccineum]
MNWGEVNPTRAYYNGSCTSKDTEDPSWSTSFKTRRTRKTSSALEALWKTLFVLYLYMIGTLFPPGFKRNNSSVKQGFNANVDIKINDKQSFASPSSSFTSEQMQKLLSLINDNTFGSIHVNMAVDITCLNITVGHPNGTFATISHVGNLKLSNNDLKKEKFLETCSKFGGLYLFDMNKDCSVVLSALHNDLKISKSCYVPVCEVCHKAK